MATSGIAFGVVLEPTRRITRVHTRKTINSHHIATGTAEKHPRPKYTVPKPGAVLACGHPLAVELGDLGEVPIRVTLRLSRGRIAANAFGLFEVGVIESQPGLALRP